MGPAMAVYPTKLSTTERIFRTVADVLGVDESALNDRSSPETIEAWDSLNHLNLVMALEAEFDVRLSPDDTLHMHNIGMIRRLLDQGWRRRRWQSRDVRRTDADFGRIRRGCVFGTMSVSFAIYHVRH